MQKRKLGNSNLEVSALGLGCMTVACVSNFFGQSEKIQASLRLSAALPSRAGRPCHKRSPPDEMFFPESLNEMNRL
jgi:hypothetical protein